MNYVKNLRFQDKPDYKFMRQIFRDLFKEKGYKLDYNYCWNVMRKKEEPKPKARVRKNNKKEKK